jgi:hypothetical protein
MAKIVERLVLLTITIINFRNIYSASVPKKYSSLILKNSKASKVITLKYILLDRGKANLNCDILQLYIYKKLTDILINFQIR